MGTNQRTKVNPCFGPGFNRVESLASVAK